MQQQMDKTTSSIEWGRNPFPWVPTLANLNIQCTWTINLLFIQLSYISVIQYRFHWLCIHLSLLAVVTYLYCTKISHPTYFTIKIYMDKILMVNWSYKKLYMYYHMICNFYNNIALHIHSFTHFLYHCLPNMWKGH